MGCCTAREYPTLGTIENDCLSKISSHTENYKLHLDLSAKFPVGLINSVSPVDYNCTVDVIQQSSDPAFLLHILKAGPDPLRLVATEQLLELARSGQEHFAEEVVAGGGLPTLVRWLGCSHNALRMKCAALCSLMYKGSTARQDLFVDVNGHYKLVQLLSWNSGEAYGCRKVLKYIEALLLDSDRHVRVYIGQHLHEAMLYEVLRQCQQTLQSPKLLTRVRQLKSLLVTEVLRGAKR